MKNQKWQFRLRISLMIIVLGIIPLTGLYTDIKSFGGTLIGIGLGSLITGYINYKKEENQK